MGAVRRSEYVLPVYMLCLCLAKCVVVQCMYCCYIRYNKKHICGCPEYVSLFCSVSASLLPSGSTTAQKIPAFHRKRRC